MKRGEYASYRVSSNRPSGVMTAEMLYGIPVLSNDVEAEIGK